MDNVTRREMLRHAILLMALHTLPKPPKPDPLDGQEPIGVQITQEPIIERQEPHGIVVCSTSALPYGSYPIDDYFLGLLDYVMYDLAFMVNIQRHEEHRPHLKQIRPDEVQMWYDSFHAEVAFVWSPPKHTHELCDLDRCPFCKPWPKEVREAVKAGKPFQFAPNTVAAFMLSKMGHRSDFLFFAPNGLECVPLNWNTRIIEKFNDAIAADHVIPFQLQGPWSGTETFPIIRRGKNVVEFRGTAHDPRNEFNDIHGQLIKFLMTEVINVPEEMYRGEAWRNPGGFDTAREAAIKAREHQIYRRPSDPLGGPRDEAARRSHEGKAL
jgi:hypothetical protein